MIITVPEDNPETIPAGFTVPKATFEEVQVPPGVKELNAIFEPTQTEAKPVSGAGKVFIVILFVVLQPVGSVYVIVAVPAETPVTKPELFTLAFVVFEELQVPPEGVDPSRILEPTQTFEDPAIADGREFTNKAAEGL